MLLSLLLKCKDYYDKVNDNMIIQLVAAKPNISIIYLFIYVHLYKYIYSAKASEARTEVKGHCGLEKSM